MSKPRGSFRQYGVLISIAVILFSPLLLPRFLDAREVTTNLTTIYVDSRKGADTNDGATRNSALKTITKALSITSSKAVISLAGGTYSEATGESFPLVIKHHTTLKGITHAQGQGVVIRGGGSFISPTAAEQNVTIAAIKKVKAIRGVMVTNPNSRGHGLWIESASPEITESTFSRNGNTGLSVNGASNPLIQNNYFFNNNGNGLLVYGTSRPIVRDNVFDKTGFGVSIVEQAAPILNNNQFQGNRIAIILEGESQARLRNNKIIDSLEYGLVAIAQSKLDLGSAQDLGNNIFHNNQKLDIQNITGNTISATGTTTKGDTQGAIDFSSSAKSVLVADEIKATERNHGINPNPNTISSRLRDNPLPVTTAKKQDPPRANLPIESQETLPPPPIIGKVAPIERPPTRRELVFSAPSQETISNAQPPQSIRQPSPPSNNNAFKRVSSINNPSVLGSTRNSAGISSLSDLLSSSNGSDSQATTYRVLVEFANQTAKNKILDRYPEAFETVYLTKPMLQIGAFSDRSLAESTSRSLADLGLITHILD